MRPFEAISRWSKEKAVKVYMPSPLTDYIFKWFEDHSPKGSHAIGAMYISAFYFDAYFWQVEIPIAFGTVKLNALDALRQMPRSIKAELERNQAIMWRYIELWVDSLDYAFGMDDLGQGTRLQSGNSDFSRQLIASAHRELCATVRLLTESRQPNSKALESARMATEMFLKAYLAVHAGLNERTAAKAFSHDLEKLAAECKVVSRNSSFDDLLPFVKLFPPVRARYEALAYENHLLWSGYAVALRSGVTFTRSLTDRDSRHQIRSST